MGQLSQGYDSLFSSEFSHCFKTKKNCKAQDSRQIQVFLLPFNQCGCLFVCPETRSPLGVLFELAGAEELK